MDLSGRPGVLWLLLVAVATTPVLGDEDFAHGSGVEQQGEQRLSRDDSVDGSDFDQLARTLSCRFGALATSLADAMDRAADSASRIIDRAVNNLDPTTTLRLGVSADSAKQALAGYVTGLSKLGNQTMQQFVKFKQAVSNQIVGQLDVAISIVSKIKDTVAGGVSGRMWGSLDQIQQAFGVFKGAGDVIKKNISDLLVQVLTTVQQTLQSIRNKLAAPGAMTRGLQCLDDL